MTAAEEIAALERKLAAREGKPGYETNVAAIRVRIAELVGDVEPSPEGPPEDLTELFDGG